MPVAALQSRRNKFDSPIDPDNLQDRDKQVKPAAPQLPPFRSLSTGVDETNWHIVASHAEEDHTRVKDGLPESPCGLDPIEPTQPSLDDGGAPDRHDNSFTGPAASTEDESQSTKKLRETELLDLNGKLIEQQKDVSAKRLQIRELRTALRYKREEESELRAKWTKHLNSFFANLNHHDTELLHGFEHLQLVTEQYLTMENSYHLEEDQLEEQEFMLDLSMEHFAALSGKGPMPNNQTHAGPWNQHVVPKSRPELPRCVINYLSRIGDERMFQENLSELESEWVVTMEKRDQRRQLRIPLDEDSEDFLRTFDEERLQIWNDLNNAQRDVNELRIICLEQGYSNFDYEDLSSLNPYQYGEKSLWEPDMNPLKLPPQEQFQFSTEMNPTGQDNGLFPDLDWDTPEMSPVQRLQFFHSLEQNKSMSSAEFINKWMLHQLRISSMGIWHLERFPAWQPLREQGWQDHDITQHVLNGWFSDETALAPSSNTSYLYLDETAAAHVNEPAERLKSSSMPSLSQTSAPPKLGRRRNSRA
ncbi:hypothetical protein BDW59DRAFT_174349 [Aspergillus cavernicola]|uniref:Uncharacterized protein n=1 Tax=Aspergillus cavernicola TaxID=176166 RepID=A0ABR4HZM9_9EURO